VDGAVHARLKPHFTNVIRSACNRREGVAGSGWGQRATAVGEMDKGMIKGRRRTSVEHLKLGVH
jgi:hypothetical protein